MTATILITRARGDEEELTDALHAKGYHVIHEPLTEIFLLHTARPAITQALEADPDAVLVTSRHGVRALAALTDVRDLPLLCVGEATLAAAVSLGFSRACATGRTADDMLDYIRAAYDEDAHFLYASGMDVRTDIAEALAGTGMRAERVVTYEAQAVKTLSEVLIHHLQHRQIDAVTFLSQRAAQIFTELLAGGEQESAAAAMQACCISQAVAGALAEEAWAGICVAAQPTLASVADCVDNALR